MTASTMVLMLADGRLPAGGHAHSGGVEAAVASGVVSDVDSLGAFLRGRLATAGLVAAAFAAAACHGTSTVEDLDAELDARTPSPAVRRASRAQGRALLRAARAMFAITAPGGSHHAVALGVVARAAGLGPRQAAQLAGYGSVAGPASAAVRLLGLDPYAVQAMLASMAEECDRTAARAAAHATDPPDALPAAGAPLLDIGAEVHASWEVRLFAS